MLPLPPIICNGCFSGYLYKKFKQVYTSLFELCRIDFFFKKY